MRWLRICIVAALAAGIVLAAVDGGSFAAQVTGQVGYGAPQQIGEQIINPKKTGNSSTTVWAAVLLIAAILGTAGFVGWRRAHPTEYP